VSASRVQFRAGSSRRGTGGSLHPASQLIASPLYDYYTVDFDVAVARVSGRHSFVHSLVGQGTLSTLFVMHNICWKISNILRIIKEISLTLSDYFELLVIG
jgi:hypothetical protein